MSSRTRRILELVQTNDEYRHILHRPKYETTKGLSEFERNTACRGLEYYNENIDNFLKLSKLSQDVPENNCNYKTTETTAQTLDYNTDVSHFSNKKISILSDVLLHSNEETTHTKVFQTLDVNTEISDKRTTISSDQNKNYYMEYENNTAECEQDPYASDGSEDEYIPDSSTSDSDSSSSSSESDLNLEEKNVENLISNNNSTRDKPNIIENIDMNTEKDENVIEEGNMNVDCSVKKVTTSAKKSYTKNFFCIFCKKIIRRFGRHIITMHKNEPRVQDIIKYPVKHFIRQNLITELRNEGSLLYNSDLTQKDLIVTRRPNVKFNRTAKDYLPCTACSAYYISKNLSKHFKKCSKNKEVVARKERIKAKSRRFLLQTQLQGMDLHPSVPVLLNVLKDDEVSAVIKKDTLLLHITSFMCHKYSVEKHLKYYSRQKLRQLARLSIAIKSNYPEITELKECFKPENFRKVISGVQKLCCLDIETGRYRKPAMANHLGIYLREACDIFHSLCIMEHDHITKQHISDFKNLLNFEYSAFVARTARKNIEESKWNNPQALPATSDILIFRNHLIAKAETAFDELENSFSYISWRTLSEVTAALILTFNRKRPGEMERILLSSYHARQKIMKDSDEYQTMSTLEKLLSQTFERLEIRGKRGRRVPVLLRENHIRYINVILKYRNEAGVSDENIYLFGLKKHSHINLNNILRSEALVSKAKQPELLRATLLRKQVATTSQLLDLNDNEMQLLADFMGHDIDIHKAHYRTSELQLQVATMSKFLLAVDNGDINKYKGRNFKTLEVETYLKNIEEERNVQEEPLFQVGSESNQICGDIENMECTQNGITFSLDSPQININDETTNTMATEILDGNSEVTQMSNEKRNIESGSVTRRSRNKIIRRTWRTPEKYAVRHIFKAYLESNKLPSGTDVLKLTRNEPRLRSRTSMQIKAWINNEIKRKKLNF